MGADIAYAGWWWFVLVVLSALLWPCVLVLPTRSLRWALVRLIAKTALRLMRIRVSVSGEEYLVRRAGVTVVNHSSYLDVVVLAALSTGEPVFVAKRELANQFVAGPFLRRLGARFADRAVAQAGLREVEEFKDVVSGGKQLVVFPEATFFRMPGLLPFRLGAFSIACAAGADVRPIAIRGTRSILRGEQWFPRRGGVNVEVLEPVEPGGQDFAAAIKLRDRVRQAILAHCGEPDMAAQEVVFPKDESSPAAG